MNRLSDEEIVVRYQQQPHTAASQSLLSELFQRHHRRVCAWCYRCTGDRESALDLAQEVFLSAFRSIHAFRGECKFSTWLYKIARNHCFNERRRTSYDGVQTSEAVLGKVADRSADPYRRLEQSSRRELGQQLLRTSLTETEMRVMTLHFAEEMPLDAVSHLLHLQNASGARAFLVSAKRKLARAVERQMRRPGTIS